MRPHRFDPISFVFGLLFLGTVLMASTGTLDLNGQTFTWIGAAFLLFLGVLLLAGSRTSDRRRSLGSSTEED